MSNMVLVAAFVVALSRAATVLGQPDAEAAAQIYATARQLVDEGRYVEAITAFEELYRVELSARALYNIGACHEFLGNYAEAQQRYQAVLGFPSLPDDLRSEVEDSVRRVTEAQGFAPTLERDATEDARQAYATGEQIFAQGRYAEALASFQQSYDVVPYPETLFNIGTCLELLGRYADARIRYQAVAALPDVPPELRSQANAGLVRVTQAERGATVQPGQPLPPVQGQGAGLASTAGTSLWERLDTDRDHGGPGGYFFVGGGGCLGGDCQDAAQTGVAGGAGFLWRFTPHFSVTAEFGFDVFDTEYTLLDLTTDSASSIYIDGALGLRFHILRKGFFDPWLSIGAGVARWSFDYASTTFTTTGFLGQAAVGVDFFISNYISLGLRFDQRIPIWSDTSESSGLFDFAASPDDLWFLTIGGTFYFLSS